MCATREAPQGLYFLLRSRLRSPYAQSALSLMHLEHRSPPEHLVRMVLQRSQAWVVRSLGPAIDVEDRELDTEGPGRSRFREGGWAARVSRSDVGNMMEVGGRVHVHTKQSGQKLDEEDCRAAAGPQGTDRVGRNKKRIDRYIPIMSMVCSRSLTEGLLERGVAE